MSKATIFIRAYNEGALIGRCLEQIFAQDYPIAPEVIVLDCESTDDTVVVAQRYPVKVYSIPKALFSYSKALNFGIQKASGEFFLALSAHAVPRDKNWLRTLIAPLEGSEQIVGCFSRQLPWPEASTLQAAELSQNFPEHSWIRSSSEVRHATARGESWYDLCCFSNASSCIRRSWLLLNPFYELPFSEDRLFALQAYEAGNSIAYVAESAVYHSHPPSYEQSYAIARNATVARGMISAWGTQYCSRLHISPYTPSLVVHLLKFPLLLGYLTLAKLRNRRAPGASTYLHALNGTYWGKCHGIRTISSSYPLAPPPIADCAAMLAQAQLR